MAMIPMELDMQGELINSTAQHIYAPTGATTIINDLSLPGGHTYLIVGSYKFTNAIYTSSGATVLSSLYDGSSNIETSYRYNNGDCLVAFYAPSSTKTVSLRTFHSTGSQQEIADVSLKAYRLD